MFAPDTYTLIILKTADMLRSLRSVLVSVFQEGTFFFFKVSGISFVFYSISQTLFTLGFKHFLGVWITSGLC